MTQFQPPPDAPGSAPTAQPPYVHAGSGGPPPWSAASIAGFVLSLLGCTGITAPFGLIFGIVGIARTGGGARRGRGLAIAAIPISLVTGMLAVFLTIAFMTFGTIAMFMSQHLPVLLSADLEDPKDVVSFLREVASDDFNASVGDAELQAWLQDVAAKHGRLVTAGKPTAVRPTAESGVMGFDIEGKFINGRTSILISLSKEGWRYAIDDIAVDGVSPREPD